MNIEQLITKDTIILDKTINTKEQLFEKVASVLLENGIVSDKDKFKEDLFAREAETPTGIIDGFGIPHAQSEAVIKPSLVFIKSDIISDYETLDESKVDTAFVIAVPKTAGSEHLDILSGLARKLMKESFRQSLRNSQTEEEILSILKGEEL